MDLQAAETNSSISVSFLSNCDIENVSGPSEVSLSPSGTRKVAAPSGAVVCTERFEWSSKGGGAGGDVGDEYHGDDRQGNGCCSSRPRCHPRQEQGLGQGSKAVLLESIQFRDREMDEGEFWKVVPGCD